MNKPAHIQYLDMLRCVAMLSVIIIHVASPLVNMTYAKNMEYWWIGNIFNSAVRFAVPLFLMLSGATMLGKNYDYKDFIKRRFSRVVIPFLFWIIIYWIYRWYSLKPAVQPHYLESVISWGVNLFLNEGVSKHFWYIYMIVFLYPLIPLAGKLFQRLNNLQLLALVFVWLIFLIFMRDTPFNAYGWKKDYWSKFSGYLLYSGYMLLGFYISRIRLPWKRLCVPAAIVYVATVCVISYMTFSLSSASHKLNLYHYSYLSMNTVAQTIAVFVFFKDMKSGNPLADTMIDILSKNSYGIYLVHILIIGLLFQHGIYWSFTYPLVSLPALTLFVALFSFIIIYLLKKIPGGKYIAG
ncbi:MAG: acyltransferase family protein [Paludibacter sp.]|nr:acyltransferase family protein [Paludibacter sp.]